MSNATTSKRTCPRSGSSTRAPPLLLMPSSKRSAAATESRFVDLVDPSHAKGRNFHSLVRRGDDFLLMGHMSRTLVMPHYTKSIGGRQGARSGRDSIAAGAAPRQSRRGQRRESLI